MTQLEAVRLAMSKGEWWTLEQLTRYARGLGCKASEAGVSARIRDLRAEGLTIDREPVRAGSTQYRYRMVANEIGGGLEDPATGAGDPVAVSGAAPLQLGLLLDVGLGGGVGSQTPRSTRRRFLPGEDRDA